MTSHEPEMKDCGTTGKPWVGGNVEASDRQGRPSQISKMESFVKIFKG